MKNVYLIHGWEGSPDDCWFPWLKKKLEGKFEVINPLMPNAEAPEINSWVAKLTKIIKNPDEHTFFIGHSIGCQAIMRYLETLPSNTKSGGVIFVAPFFNLPYLETEEEKIIAKPWLETRIDTDKIKKFCDFVTIFSDNDPDVPLSDSELFKERLNAKVIVEHDKGHFSDDAGIVELPIVLEELLKMSD